MSGIQSAGQTLENRKNLIRKHLGTSSPEVSEKDWALRRKAKEAAAFKEAQAIFAGKRMRQIEKETQGQTFDNFLCREPWQRNLKGLAEAYAKNPEGWFYIGGQSGCGKTHLCLAICKQLANQREFVTFCRWREEIWLLKDRSFEKADERQRRLWAVKGAGTLFIDDFLKGENGIQEKQIAFEIIDARYQAGRRTIISSEYPLRRIAESYDEAVGGRVMEMCGDYVLTIPADKAKNYRARRRKETEV